MKIRSLDEPKLEPERIRSFKFCQPKKFSRTSWFRFNIQSCNSEKMFTHWETNEESVISTFKSLIIVEMRQ
jgi:hypothetical protein